MRTTVAINWLRTKQRASKEKEREREQSLLLSTPSTLSQTSKHLLATLHLSLLFLIATYIVTRLLVGEIFHLSDLAFD